MPLGTPVDGSLNVLLCGTTSSPATPIGGNSSWDWPADKPTSRHDYYGQATFSTLGKANRTPTVSCDYETADTGQKLLHDAWVSGATVWLMEKVDGTNGETLPVKITGRTITGADVNNPATVQFSTAQQGDPTVVAGGFGT